MAYGEEAVRFDSNLGAHGERAISVRIVAGLSYRSKRSCEAIHWNRIRARRLSDGSSLFDRANPGVKRRRGSLAEPHDG
jgi:hypothetical protein